MFDKLKEINKLRELRKQLKEEKVEIERNGVVVIVNGGMEIEELRLNPDLDLRRQTKSVKNAINDALRKIQISSAKKMKDSGDFEF